MIGLTERQHEMLVFIREYVAEHDGVAPTFDEIGAALNMGKSGVHRMVTGLEARGHIRRLRHSTRAIEVLDTPGPLHAISTEDLIAEALRRGLTVARLEVR